MIQQEQQMHNLLAHKLAAMDEYDVVRIWNEYCNDTDHAEWKIYDNEEDTINSLFKTPMEVTRSISLGEYSYFDEYFKLDQHCCIISFKTIIDEKSPYYAEYLIKWLIKQETESIFFDISDIFDDLR